MIYLASVNEKHFFSFRKGFPQIFPYLNVYKKINKNLLVYFKKRAKNLDVGRLTIYKRNGSM